MKCYSCFVPSCVSTSTFVALFLLSFLLDAPSFCCPCTFLFTVFASLEDVVLFETLKYHYQINYDTFV